MKARTVDELRPALDERLLRACVRAYTRGHLFVTRPVKSGGNTYFTGKSLDVVLADNGVSFDQDRGLYLAYERAARGRAMANLERARR